MYRKLFSQTLLPTEAKPGHRYTLPCPTGSAQALWLAQLAQESQRCVLLCCADPLQAQWLLRDVQQLAPGLRTHFFPDWETLPYERFSPHQDLVSERLQTLYALSQGQVDLLIVPLSTALMRLPPTAYVAAYSFAFTQGQTLSEAAFTQQLLQANYMQVSQVGAPGEFSLRGSIIDLFPMGSPQPYRIDLLDDEIEQIHALDVNTQRRQASVPSLRLLPGREFPFDDAARQGFRQRFRDYFEGDPSRALPYKEVSNGLCFAGIEYYLPLFFEQTATLFDYVPHDTIIVSVGDFDPALHTFAQDTQSRYQFLCHDKERPLLPPEALFLSSQAFYQACKPFIRLHIDKQPDPHFPPCPPMALYSQHHEPFLPLQTAGAQGQRLLICADSPGRLATLRQNLNTAGLNADIVVDSVADFIADPQPLAMVVCPLFQGFAIPSLNAMVLTESELYPQRVGRDGQRQRDKVSDIQTMVRDVGELQIGDPIVHIQHGIGLYRGLQTMALEAETVEMLQIDYADDSKLYVPVTQLHLIGRYTGSDNPPLHKLGSRQWQKAKAKSAEQAHDTAAELLALYAQRSLRKGYAFTRNEADYQTFVQGFGFEETPDQAQAIEAVLADMQSPQPMDRLVCGDVGFGKTEVALRAAFLCVANGQQVALLCPTTLLAEQHAKTFANRFADWPVRVAELSRFVGKKQTDALLQAIAEGQVDIVVGTHKLLSDSVKFKQLGLLIIDEEHRFGVRQKEKLKALRADIDVLTLTATPIPRTLSMSLEGIRDLSVIATAPQKRLSIKTFVRAEDNGTLREAILRELKRGGQVYFLHNEIKSIEMRKEALQALVPEARIVVAHGQMHERELTRIMRDFHQQRFNVLLCTTIIETGIDVPSANTIIIHRADRLGLAQLHQIRGRVGRSHHQAYAYLLVSEEATLNPQATQRLEAIQSSEALGAGFYLAMHDLEIRGVGEVLGDQQSGHIHAVGFTLYQEMLDKAIRAMKSGETPDLLSPPPSGPDIRLHTPALLPSDYCPDVQQRLQLYKRLSHVQSKVALQSLEAEMIDRFGTLPPAAQALLYTHQLRLVATPMGVSKLDIAPECAIIGFAPDKHGVDPVRLIECLQQQRQLRLQGPDKLRWQFNDSLTLEQRLQQILRLLAQLNGNGASNSKGAS